MISSGISRSGNLTKCLRDFAELGTDLRGTAADPKHPTRTRTVVDWRLRARRRIFGGSQGASQYDARRGHARGDRIEAPRPGRRRISDRPEMELRTKRRG